MRETAAKTFLFLLLAAAAAAAQSGGDENKCDYGDMDARCTFTKQDDWAYIMMVQTWPGTFCHDGCCRVPKDVDAVRDGFTIHGFWPNYNGSKYPACCTSPYTKTQVEAFIQDDFDLKVQLDTYWPALKKCKFVEYEFDKHGTCATTVYDGAQGPVDYWDAAMYLAKRWDFKQILASAGIVPSDSKAYSTGTFQAAVDKAVGKRAALACDSSNNRHLLEVRVCIERPTSTATKLRPQPMDCPSTISSNCNKDSLYLLPIPKIPTGGCS